MCLIVIMAEFSVLSHALTIRIIMIEPARKAKIKWQCRRGMLELDLILQPFINHHLDNLTLSQLDAFELLLAEPDPVLYSWLMGASYPSDKELEAIVELVKSNHKHK